MRPAGIIEYKLNLKWLNVHFIAHHVMIFYTKKNNHQILKYQGYISSSKAIIKRYTTHVIHKHQITIYWLKTANG
jgi:hypothetical protein